MQRGDRPPHLISPEDVADWLIDSVNGRVTYHNTSPAAAAVIMQQGVDISRSQIGAYGQGFCTSTEPDDFYGIVVIDGGGDGVDYVIALDEQPVRIIQP